MEAPRLIIRAVMIIVWLSQRLGWIKLPMLMLMLKPIFNWRPKIVVRVIRKLSLNFLEQPFPVTWLKRSDGHSPLATNIGMGIKRRDAADASFITPNNSASVEWTTEDKTNGMKLTVALRETTAGTGNIGNFRESHL